MSRSAPPPSRTTPACCPVQRFLDRALPTLLRRLRLWKGLDEHLHHDVIEDLQQEIWLDYCAHRAQLDRLPERERHARWFRLLSARHYRLRERPYRRWEGDGDLDLLPDTAPAEGPWAALRAHRPFDQRQLVRLLHQARHLGNGRLNLQATARALGIPIRELHRLWDLLLEAAGQGRQFVDRWRRHLGEALLGLAAQPLLDNGTAWIHAGSLPADPDRLARRARQAAAQLRRRPLSAPLRRLAIRYDAELPRHRRLAPVPLLRDAAWLLPAQAEVHLWMADAALAARDLRRAAVALRVARRLAADEVAVALGRARLLDLRGCHRQARELLQRCRGRHPGESRLQRRLFRRAAEVPAPLLKRVS